MYTHSNYWGDADVDHSQTIGGYSQIIGGDISPHPILVSAPLSTARRCAKPIPICHLQYIDDLSVEVKKLQAGCCIGNNLINYILFADDLCCFSASLDGLQSIVNVCSKFALEKDLVFNCKKSFGVVFFFTQISPVWLSDIDFES